MGDTTITTSSIPRDLLELRYRLYAAHTTYIEALATFMDARVGEVPFEIVQWAGQSCSTTGAKLNTALTELQQWLEPHQSDHRWCSEHRQTAMLQKLLQRELAVVQRVCGPTQSALNVPKPLRRKSRREATKWL